MKKSQDIFDIEFPDTSDIERQVLVDVVANSESTQLLADIIPILHSDFFTTKDRRDIWENIVDNYNSGRPYDGGTLSLSCGPAFVTEVMTRIGKAAFSGTFEHALILRNKAASRRAFIAAASFLTKAADPSSTEQDIVSSVEEFARKVEGPAPIRTEVTIAEALEKVSEDIEGIKRAREEGRPVYVPTGIPSLDWHFYGGLHAGQLVVLAARPSVGKTALMLQFAKTAAKAGFPATIYSLEMTAEELAQRLVCSTGKVNSASIASGRVEWQAFEEANGELSPLPLYINDFSRSLDDIISRMTQAVNKGRCGVAFIDYLGLIQDAVNLGTAKLYQIIAKITGTLKAVAKRLRIPIVLLCQLNRDQARDGRAPELYDLRDSGSIEQDADIVLMLQPDYENNELIVHIKKNRNGKKEDSVHLSPNQTYSAFTETGLDMAVRPSDPSISLTNEEDDDNLPF